MSDTPMDVAYNATVTDPTPANPSPHINPAVGMKKPQYMATNQGRPSGSGIHNKPGVDIWAGSAFGKSDSLTPDNPMLPTDTYQNCECETCSQEGITCPMCPQCSGGSDAETEMQETESIGKANPCWEGYVQRGMKPGDNGKPVPNCVPVSKTESILFSAKDYTKDTRVDRIF